MRYWRACASPTTTDLPRVRSRSFHQRLSTCLLRSRHDALTRQRSTGVEAAECTPHFLTVGKETITWSATRGSSPGKSCRVHDTEPLHRSESETRRKRERGVECNAGGHTIARVAMAPRRRLPHGNAKMRDVTSCQGTDTSTPRSPPSATYPAARARTLIVEYAGAKPSALHAGTTEYNERLSSCQASTRYTGPICAKRHTSLEVTVGAILARMSAPASSLPAYRASPSGKKVIIPAELAGDAPARVVAKMLAVARRHDAARARRACSRPPTPSR